MSLALLKQRLAEIAAAPKLGVSILGLPTGLNGLDAALPARGIPRGRVTEVAGARGSGKTTLLRHLVETTVARGLCVAYVDAARTLAPRDWVHVGRNREQGAEMREEGEANQGLWMVRPPRAAKGAWCADVLLRSGAFALVVLDGAPPLARSVATRLTHLARESNAALVVVGADERSATTLAAALKLRVQRGSGAGGTHPASLGTRRVDGQRGGNCRLQNRGPSSPGAESCLSRPQAYGARARPSASLPCLTAPPPRHPAAPLVITVEKGGIRRTVEVSYGVNLAHRLCTHPEIPDRRGVERSRDCALG